MSYLVVEGPIGAGKTSLSQILADNMQARLILEVVEENPFLEGFYRDRAANAFKAQLFFLLSRYKQLQEIRQGTLFNHHTISDYSFDKDVIFASLNLSGAEWELYRELYEQLRPKVVAPDLTVYLRAQPELLLERIRKRGRSFEAAIDETYLRQLGEAYDRHFEAYARPLHVIEAAQCDFVSNRADRQRVVAEIVHLARAA